MGKRTGFIEFGRKGPQRRPVPLRVHDWREIYEAFPEEDARIQAARCMDCGIPFCHEGCPLGNLIPEWNDLVWRGDWSDAVERLHATNNFPEMTGRLCPAPCEGSCVLGINAEPVNIKQTEFEISERAFSEEWASPQLPSVQTGRRVAIVGSGPAGLAAAQQLTRAGHEVVVYERAARPGGLLRYGIPEFKMEKAVLDRRLAQMRAEGTRFVTGVIVGARAPHADGDAGGPVPHQDAGVDGTTAAHGAQVVPAAQLVEEFDAVVVATGATVPRRLAVPGAELDGVHVAMAYLQGANRACEDSAPEPPITAAGKRVVILGGGDTGADCLGTAHRQGALSVQQLEILPQPPAERGTENPWPTWPVIFRTSGAHEEGGERIFAVETAELLGDEDGRLRALRYREVRPAPDGRGFEAIAGTDAEIPCELVLLAMGFLGTERDGLVAELGLDLTARGQVAVGAQWETNVDGVFACGDAARGQSLVVWAIAEGRSMASAVDRHLMGTTALPSPLRPGQLALR